MRKFQEVDWAKREYSQQVQDIFKANQEKKGGGGGER